MSNEIVDYLKTVIGKDISSSSPSQYMRWLDGRLEEVEVGQAKVSFVVRKEMCNPAMLLHGGVIAGMLDEVAGISVYTLGRENVFTTINLDIDFLRPANVGQKVIVESKVIRSGKRLINVEVTMKYQDKLLAKASSNLIRIGKEVPPSSIIEQNQP